jgi:Domain of unknown function (DUF4406)
VILVYVAGKFRGPDHWAIQKNIQEAERVAWHLWAKGYSVICPHLNTAHFQGSLPDDIWLYGDLEQVRRSDAVVLVPGWAASTGTKGEVEFAKERGIPVFEWDPQVLDALNIEPKLMAASWLSVWSKGVPTRPPMVTCYETGRRNPHPKTPCCHDWGPVEPE